MNAVADVMLVIGASMSLLAALALYRFDDVMLRLHAATKPATLGAVLLLGGTGLRLGFSGGAFKVVLVVVFQFLTAPIAAHLLARAITAGTADQPAGEADPATG